MSWSIYIFSSNQTSENMPKTHRKLDNLINNPAFTLLGYLKTNKMADIRWITNYKLKNLKQSIFIGDTTDINYLNNLIKNLKINSIGFSEVELKFNLGGLDYSSITFIEEFRDIISSNLDDYIYIYIK